jgi:hypothetical protein
LEVFDEEKHMEELQYKETLSDVDDEELDQYFLPEEQVKMKSMLWHHMHQDWIDQQNFKKQQQSEKKGPKKTRRKMNREPVNAPDPLSALKASEKFGQRVNIEAIRPLFEPEKKLKTESLLY